MFDVIVIGSGLAGVLSALKIPLHYKVLLIEAGCEVLPSSSSSNNQCYKLHTGMHYSGDFPTAEHCLRKSIEFAREFPEFIAGGGNLLAPWRRGRHYFMSNSLVAVEKAKELALYLQDIYRKAVEADVCNKVFGEPENFMRFLSKEDYPHIAEEIPFYDVNGTQSMINVDFCVETGESQIDFVGLKAHLQKKVGQSSNITFLPYNMVIGLNHNLLDFGYVITTKNETGIINTYTATSIINCAWQNIEFIDSKIGLYIPDEYRVNRIKASVLVSLPETLRNINTSIFSSGPYCSMTILPNGQAILTSERTTNIGYVQAGCNSYSKEMLDLLNVKFRLNSPYGQSIAKSILNECASYLQPELSQYLINAQVDELHVGFVKLMNNINQYTYESIYQNDSDIHARQQDGIEERDLGYFSNSGMKATFTVSNAVSVVDKMKHHFILIAAMKRLVLMVIDMILPFLASINYEINNFTMFLYVNYRDRLKEDIVSGAFDQDPTFCAEKLKTEITAIFEKRNALNKDLLSSFSSFAMINFGLESAIISFRRVSGANISSGK